jgi:predicted  nucleic acid-binding Zn-ribbon protein
MAAESVQVLQLKIKLYEDGVREIRRLTTEIDELKESLPPLEAKISELANVSRGYESFKESADECLTKLRKRKQKLENKSHGPCDDAKRASNLESVTFEISQIETRSSQLEAEHMKCEEETNAAKKRALEIENQLNRLIRLRNDLFDKMLNSSQ